LKAFLVGLLARSVSEGESVHVLPLADASGWCPSLNSCESGCRINSILRDLSEEFSIATSSDYGRRALGRSRALCVDVLHYHQKVPTTAHDRVCDFSRVVALRAQLPQRISWSMLFIKAYGLVAAKIPELRQSCITWPWPHVYQHEHNVAMVVLHREHQGRPWLFWGRFLQPELQPLTDLQTKLDWYQTAPVESAFRKQWQASALPWPVRRLGWWWTLNVALEKRARRTGTFFLTTLASRGAEIRHPPAFLTSNISYGPLDDQGRSRVTIAYDHRLMDGVLIADVLADLERTINGELAEELEDLTASASSSNTDSVRQRSA